MTETTNGQSVVAAWNEIGLEAIRAGGAKPTETTYQLHLSSAAVYDAWAALDTVAVGQYSNIATSLANTTEIKAEAVSFAAYTALSELFPEEQKRFEDFLISLGYDPADAVADPDTAAGLGTLAALNVFEARVGDGSNSENDYADTSGYAPVNSADPSTGRVPGGIDFDPNHWQPLRVPTGFLKDENGVPISDDSIPESYVDQIALTPHWGDVESFSLYENSMFRPDAPPELGDFSTYIDGTGAVTTGDQAYRDQIDAVLNASAELTNEEKVIAEYWADGPRTESPPGHWNQIAQDIALREGHGIDEDAKLFFAVNAALFDAGIATWEAKYAYDYVRPQSAIRDLYFDQTVEAWGGVNQGTQEILGQEWQPYQNVTFVTPPFPEYVSGHSTFSMAAANTIAAFVGTDTFYDGTSRSNYDLDGVEGIDLLGQYVTSELVFEEFEDGPAVVLQWDTLTEAAEEAGISRIYGGIHIQDGNLNGLEVGRQVADSAELRWNALFNGTVGTGESDLLVGTTGDDLIAFEGGAIDKGFGGAGADIFRFTDTTDIRDHANIFDFDTSEDTLDLNGAIIKSVTDLGFALRISLTEDNDQINLFGVEDFGDVLITNEGTASEEVPEPSTIVGTDAGETLIGDAGDNLILLGGGAIDKAFGNGGSDTFQFADTEGARDHANIFDFDVTTDTLDLAGATIQSVTDLGFAVRILLTEDADQINLFGLNDLSDVTIINEGLDIA